MEITQDEFGGIFVESPEKKRLVTSDELERLEKDMWELRYDRPSNEPTFIPSFKSQNTLIAAYILIFVGFIMLSRYVRREL